LKNNDVKSNSFLFEYDTKLNKEKGFVFYDFNKPLEVAPELKNSFDIILIDPPFITEEVWSKYA
jgi:16S rRNA G966 N2-methylase RsmD